jgi:hypothetical protein
LKLNIIIIVGAKFRAFFAFISRPGRAFVALGLWFCGSPFPLVSHLADGEGKGREGETGSDIAKFFGYFFCCYLIDIYLLFLF